MPRASRPTDRTVKERGIKFREERDLKGWTQCLVWVPKGRCDEIKVAAELMRANPELTIGTLRDTGSGKLVSLYPKRAAARRTSERSA